MAAVQTSARAPGQVREIKTGKTLHRGLYGVDMLVGLELSAIEVKWTSVEEA